MSSSQTVSRSPSLSSRRILHAATLTVAAALLPVTLTYGQAEPAAPDTAAPLVAQATPATTQAAEATQTTQPATRAAANGQAGGIVKQNGGLLLNFRDASIDVVLDELSAAAGFIVVKEVKPEGRVTLTSRQPVSKDDA